jgi:hypothetical protein
MHAKYKSAIVGWICGFIVATIIFFDSFNHVKTTLLELLNSNTAMASATIFYAFLTYFLVSETKKMRKAQTEPEISITIQPSEEWINFIDIVIENVGLGSARNIRFEVISDFECEKGKFVSNIGYIKNGLDYFAPKQKLIFFLTSMVENFEEKITKRLEIKVIYQDKTNKSYDPTFKIDFSQLEGLIQSGNPPLYMIAEEIKKIQEDIHLISTGKKRIEVVAYTKNEIEEEKKEQKKLLERLKNKPLE